ncbi:MAG: hypothetical protein HYR72_25950 [Deltaproteobacteria bacterium]|nr:hypothetical protein [Deltaproteobacteria bacterium]MBI3390858.1 hypothetical protein [Deltaproteobacteria bacterium]
MTNLVEVVWYTIPGAIFLVPLLSPSPQQLVCNAMGFDKAAGLAGIFFLVGYVLHQMARAVFEFWFVGYAMGARSAITCIQQGGKWEEDKDRHRWFRYRNDFQRGCREERTWRLKAQAVWELGAYNSSVIKEEMYRHIQRAWNYWISFQAIAFSSVLSIVSAMVCHGCTWWIPIQLIIVVVFWLKSELTLEYINRQEVLLVRTHWSCAFEKYFRQSGLTGDAPA